MSVEHRERVPADSVSVSSIKKPSGGIEIQIVPGEEAWNIVRKMAAKRSETLGRPVSVPQLIAESLRAESLLADGKLLVKEKGRYAELIGV